MIITCPSCGARYKVRDDLIPSSGKRVKCKKCASLFRAFPGKKAILEQAAPKPPEPAPKPAEPVSAQATVMVDQAKLSNFLQQNNLDSSSQSPDPTPAQPLVPEAPKPSHATVQIDRTKIDAFLQHKVDNAGGDYEPNTTLEVSREELDTFLSKPKPEEAEDSDQTDSSYVPREDAYEPKVDPDKYEDLQRAVGSVFKDPAEDKPTIELPSSVSLAQSAPEEIREEISAKASAVEEVAADLEAAQNQLDLTVPDRFDLQAQDQIPTAPSSFDAPDEEFVWDKPKQPQFPTDEELGLVAEPDDDLLSQDMPSAASFDSHDDAEEDDFLSASPGESVAMPEDVVMPADVAMPEDVVMPEDVAMSDELNEPMSVPDLGEVSSFGEVSIADTPESLFNVKVENTEYPNKSLEALDRWINEGRLLETDMVAPAGSDQFQKAYDIPEIAAIFDRYFGQNTPAAPETESKPGFFGRLFSVFSKKK